MRRREIRSNAGLHLPLTLFLVVFFVLSISHDARELYALPTLPSLALLAVPGLPLLRRGAANALWWFALMVFCFFALVGWFYWIALDLNFPARLHSHLMRLRPAYADVELARAPPAAPPSATLAAVTARAPVKVIAAVAAPPGPKPSGSDAP